MSVPSIIRITDCERQRFALNVFLNAFGDNAPYESCSIGRYILKSNADIGRAKECFEIFSARLKRNNIQFLVF